MARSQRLTRELWEAQPLTQQAPLRLLVAVEETAMQRRTPLVEVAVPLARGGQVSPEETHREHLGVVQAGEEGLMLGWPQRLRHPVPPLVVMGA